MFCLHVFIIFGTIFVLSRIFRELLEDKEASQRGEGCSMAKEGGPFSLTTSPFPPYGGNLQQIHT